MARVFRNAAVTDGETTSNNCHYFLSQSHFIVYKCMFTFDYDTFYLFTSIYATFS